MHNVPDQKERIGPPKADILSAMVHEHCNEVDSELPWTTGNYGINTTSKWELLFVLNDTFAQLTGERRQVLCALQEELDAWHKDADKLKELNSKMEGPKHGPVETRDADHPRADNRRTTWLAGLQR